MNAAEKARMAKQAQKQQKIQKKQDRRERVADFISWHGASFVVFLVLSIIAIIACGLTIAIELLGNKTFTDSMLSLFKIFFYVGLGVFVFVIILMIYGYYRSTFTYSDNADDRTCYLLFAILHTALTITLFVILIISLSSGKLKYSRYDIDHQHGVVYAQGKTGLNVIGTSTNEEEIVISGTYNGIIVNSIEKKAFKGNTTIKAITFNGGNITISKKAFADCISLEKITFEGNYKVYLDVEAFSNCLKLSEIIFDENDIHLGENTFVGCHNLKYIDFNKSSIDCYDGLYYNGIFSNNLTVKVSGGKLINFVTDLDKLILADFAEVHLVYANFALTRVNKLIIEDGFNFNESTLDNTKGSGVFSNDSDIYPMGYAIYLPASITSLPDNFFGDFAEGDIKVYFAGSEEEWANVTIGSNGNSNYSNGKVKMNYNTPYAE